MEVHRNLRTPKAAPDKRMVRIDGDGTPENTRLLDAAGEPLSELVTSYTIQGGGDGCARGTFTYLVTDEKCIVQFSPEGDPAERQFEAWVMYESPVKVLQESRESQLDRLAAFIIEGVPGEPSENEGAVDTAIRLLRELVEVPAEGERFWLCKIGPAPREVPGGGDSPLRTAVEGAFRYMFGEDAEVDFSGWGAHLTALEREVLEEDRARIEDGGPGTKDLGSGDSGTVNDPDHLPTEPVGLDVGLIGRGGDGPEEFIPAPDLEDGGIGTPVGPELDKAADAPPECFAEPRDPAVQTIPAESDEKAFARLARGGAGA